MAVISVEDPNASVCRAPHSRATLALRAYSRTAALFMAAAAALFVTAGTWNFPDAWAWLVGVFVALAGLTTLFLVRDPGAVESRLLGPRQLARWFAPLFVVAFLVPGLDFRFRWSDADVETVPKWLALGADSIVVMAILFGGYVVRITAEMRRSRPADAAHAILSTGPYHVVRHPLFTASLMVWLATPVALGSWVALPVFLLLTPYYVLQLRAEERNLMRRLPGYAAYCKRTPFRLVPFVW